MDIIFRTLQFWPTALPRKFLEQSALLVFFFAIFELDLYLNLIEGYLEVYNVKCNSLLRMGILS